MAATCRSCVFWNRTSPHSDYGNCHIIKDQPHRSHVCANYQLSPEYQAKKEEERQTALRIEQEQQRKDQETNQWYKDNASDVIAGAVAIAGVAASLYSRHSQNKAQRAADPQVAAQRSALKRNKWVAALLAIFLGMFGAQKFYLDRPKQGIILLVISLVGSLVLIGPIITTVIGIVEGIKYLASSPEQFQETYVTGDKVWF